MMTRLLKDILMIVAGTLLYALALTFWPFRTTWPMAVYRDCPLFCTMHLAGHRAS